MYGIEHRLPELAARLTLTEDDLACLRQEMSLESLRAAEHVDGSQADQDKFVDRVLRRFTLQAVRGEGRRPEHPAEYPNTFVSAGQPRLCASSATRLSKTH
jgi:hypothetical protein